jgi:hypothetical protein
MNCIFDHSRGFPAVCKQCGRVVSVGVFPIYAACSARGKATLEDAIVSATKSQEQGPGTELKVILESLGIRASSDCKCNTRAKYMNQMESENPGWCESNIETILGWLREAAGERGLPFFDAAGRIVIRRAIKNARKSHIDQ